MATFNFEIGSLPLPSPPKALNEYILNIADMILWWPSIKNMSYVGCSRLVAMVTDVFP